VLQTRPAIKAWLKEDVVREVTRGVNEVSVGMRLRYEIRREFAPYVGFEWVKKIGNAADLMRALGEDDEALHAALGVKMWW
jgi:copper resistance protein B